MKTQNPDLSKASAFAGLQTPCFFFVLLLTTILVSSYTASGQSLDGKNFLVKMYDTHIPDQTNEDVLIFSSGTFESEACRPYGYQPSSYKAKKNGKGIAFTAITKSDKEGEMHWQGTITNDRIQGTAIWKKEGQNNIEYKFEGRKKEA